MQSWLRSKALSSCAGPPALDPKLWLGLEDDVLVACVAHSRVTEGQAADCLRRDCGFDGPIRLLLALAVALTHRGRVTADAAMDHALADVLLSEDRAATFVIASIDRRNRASQRMVARNGFEFLEDDPVDPQLQRWYTIAEAE